jgi:hypothetical protein
VTAVRQTLRTYAFGQEPVRNDSSRHKTGKR